MRSGRWLIVGFLLLSSSTGCCRMCDRWCGPRAQNYYPPPAPNYAPAPAPAYAPTQACVPCCPVPCAPCNYGPQQQQQGAYRQPVPATSVSQPNTQGYSRSYAPNCACN